MTTIDPDIEVTGTALPGGAQPSLIRHGGLPTPLALVGPLPAHLGGLSPQPRDRARWPADVRLKVASNTGTRDAWLKLHLPVLPVPVAGQAKPHALLVACMTAARARVSRVAPDGAAPPGAAAVRFDTTVATQARPRTVQVTLTFLGDTVLDVHAQGQGLDRVTLQAYREACFRHHLARHFPPLLDAFQGVQVRGVRFDAVLGALLAAANRALADVGIDVRKDGGVNALISAALADAASLCAGRAEGLAAAARSLAGRTLHVGETFALLRKGFDGCPATTALSLDQRLRLFIDGKVLQALDGGPFDMVRWPLAAFVFDAEQPAYLHRYVGGLAALLGEDEPLTLARLLAVAERVSGTGVPSDARMTDGCHFTDAGLDLLADVIDLTVEVHQFTWEVRNARGDRAMFQGGPFKTYQGRDDGQPTIGGRTVDLLRRVRDGAPPAGLLTLSRQATRQDRLDALQAALDDYADRLASLQAAADDDGATPDSPNEAPTLRAALGKLMLDILLVHPMPNGNYRLAQTLVNVELARHGQSPAPLHDPSMRGDIAQMADALAQGQQRLLA